MREPRLVEIRRYDASDTQLIERVHELRNARIAADSPFRYPETLPWWTNFLKNGWDGDVPRAFVGIADGEVVAEGVITLPTYDNRHLADLSVGVGPDRRRLGFGSQILAALLTEAKQEGRTSAAVGGWDSAATRGFAAHHGFDAKIVEVTRRQVLADADWQRIEAEHANASRIASAYSLIRIAGSTPPERLAAVAKMAESINDAPIDDLDIEDEVYTPERVAKYEQSLQATSRLYRVLAQHRESGDLAGHTVVTVERDRPEIGDQDDTSVVREHRGNRLGVLLKAEMLLWLREEEPQLATLDTWNAKSNSHMIAVNELLGYQVSGEFVDFQRAIT